MTTGFKVTPESIRTNQALSVKRHRELTHYWRQIMTMSSYLMVAAIYAHGYIGISILLAGIVGLRTSGCEMRVIPYLVERLAGSNTELALCLGVWAPIDRWEARLRQENR